jgi:hypothetical protein
MNEAGDAIVVWDQWQGEIGGWSHIWANTYHFGEGWGTPSLVESDSLASCYVEDVAIDSNGNAVVLWTQYFASNITWYKWASNYSDQAGWGTPQRLNSASAGAGTGGSLAFDSAGNAVAAWLEIPDVYASRYVPGLGWGNPELIEHQAGFSQSPNVVVDADGSATAVWVSQTSERYNVWSSRYTVGSGWGLETLLEANDSGDVFESAVASDGLGNAVAVWAQGDAPYTENATYHMWSSRYAAQVGWSVPQLIEQEAVGSSYRPTVAMFRSGDAIVAWYNSDDTNISVWTCKYTASHGWQPPEPVGPQENSFSHEPRLSINREGRAFIVWQNYISYVSSRCTIGTPWSEPETVMPMTSSTCGPQHHQVCIDGQGNGLIVWEMNTGGESPVSMYASTYVAPHPGIELTSPADNSTVHEPFINVTGFTDPLSSLLVNSTAVTVAEDGSFNATVKLTGGPNVIEIVAEDSAGRSTTLSVHVLYETPDSPDGRSILLGIALAAGILIAVTIVMVVLRARRH